MPATAGDVPVEQCISVPVCEPAACRPDDHEYNGTPWFASVIFTNPDESEYVDGYYTDDVSGLFLCQGEEDWYRVPVESLDITRLRFLVTLYHVLSPTDCELCETGGMAACSEHQVTVDVYDAGTGALIATETHDRGYVRIMREDLPAGDLLIRVHGAAAANMSYRLFLHIAQWDPECDGQECDFPELCDSHC